MNTQNTDISQISPDLAHAITTTDPSRWVSEERIKSAQDHAKRAGSYADLRRYRRPLHESRAALVSAAQTTCPCCEHDEDCGKRVSSLPASCHTVYAAIRTSAVKGFAGARMSSKELSKWIALPRRTIWWAMRRLRSLRLISRTKNFANWAFTSIRLRKTYDRICIENTYALGPAAPQRHFKAQGRPPRHATPQPAPETPPKGEPARGATRDDLAAFLATVEDDTNPCARKAPEGPSAPVQELHSNSPYYVGGGGVPSVRPSHHVERASLSCRPLASDGPADRGTLEPAGSQGDAEEVRAAHGMLPSLDLSFLDDAPGRALRAAKKKGGAS